MILTIQNIQDSSGRSRQFLGESPRIVFEQNTSAADEGSIASNKWAIFLIFPKSRDATVVRVGVSCQTTDRHRFFLLQSNNEKEGRSLYGHKHCFGSHTQ